MQLPISAVEMSSTKPIVRIGHLGGELGDRARAIRRVRPHDVRLQLRQIELDHAVVVLVGVGLHLRVRLEQVLGTARHSGTRSPRPVARKYFAIRSS